MCVKQLNRLTLWALMALLLTICLPGAALADGGASGGGSGGGSSGGAGGGTDSSSPDANPGSAATIRRNYFKRFKWAKEFYDADHVQDGSSQSGGSVSVSDPLFVWPKHVNSSGSIQVPSQRDTAIGKHLVKTFGYPVSDTQFQIIQRLDDNMMLEEAFDPERRMWMETAMGAIKATSAANSVANLGRNQSAGAITFSQSFLRNFTSEANNVWQRIRNELFLPMAILLLLPGAVLSQVRAIVAQGLPVLGEVNPFEGIIRSIIAIFLIPATLLVINYGIDVSNAIANEINLGYARIVGGDMYKDAICAQKRAFPIRKDQQNSNSIPVDTNTASNPAAAAQDVFAGVESMSFDVGAGDQCSEGGSNGQSSAGNNANADEVSSVLKSTQRLVVNGANAGLASTWNVLCAFQMAYLYYLWCMGPIVAALWVWPIGQLRGALPSWVEGVVTLCFWSLFWNTTILLMACFKGVGDTGTIIMSALNFLSINCVKYAFDFSGLVKAAGEQAGKQATKGGGGGKGGGHGGGGQGAGHQGGTQAGQHGGQPASSASAAPAAAADAPSGGSKHSSASLASAMSGGSPGGPGHGRSGLGAEYALPGHSAHSGQAGHADSAPGSSDGGGPGGGPGGYFDSPVSGSHGGSSLPPMMSDSHSGGHGHSAGSASSHDSVQASQSAALGASSDAGAGGSTAGASPGDSSSWQQSVSGPADGTAAYTYGMDAPPPSAGGFTDMAGSSASMSAAAADVMSQAAAASGGVAQAADSAAYYAATQAQAADAQAMSAAQSAAPGFASTAAGEAAAAAQSGVPGGVPLSGTPDAGLPPGAGALPGSLPPGVTADAGMPPASIPASGLPPVAQGFDGSASSSAAQPSFSSPLPDALASYYPQPMSQPPPAAPEAANYSSSPQYYREVEQSPPVEQYFAYPTASGEAAPPAQESYYRTADRSDATDSASGPRSLTGGMKQPQSDAPQADSAPAVRPGGLMSYLKQGGSVRRVSRETKEWKSRSLEELQRMAEKNKDS